VLTLSCRCPDRQAHCRSTAAPIDRLCPSAAIDRPITRSIVRRQRPSRHCAFSLPRRVAGRLRRRLDDLDHMLQVSVLDFTISPHDLHCEVG
jgi:hypothetical protein